MRSRWSQPAIVRAVHDAYLDAGADIVRTNTFRAASRAHAADARDLCLAAARLARAAADAWSLRTPPRQRLVAGAVGPADPESEPGRDRHATAERLRQVFRAPLIGLLEGGVDLLLFETWWSPSQTEGALRAFVDACDASGRRVPVLVSTALAPNGRVAASGVSLAEWLDAIDPATVDGVGVNCGAGPGGLAAPLAALGSRSWLVSCAPSAGCLGRGRRRRARPRALRPGRRGLRDGGPRPHRRRLLRHHAGAHPRPGRGDRADGRGHDRCRQTSLRPRGAPGHNERRRASSRRTASDGDRLEYLIKQYPLESGALEIQYIEEYFGEFPRKKTAREIVQRLADREFLILMAEASLPDDPSAVVPVSFKVVHELRATEADPKLADLVARLSGSVRFEGRKVLYNWIGGTRRDWRGQGHFRALTEETEAWAHASGFHEVVVKTKNRFYDMRGTLDHLEFDVIKYEVHPTDNRESKVYLGKQLTSDVLRAHTSARTVVQA